DRPARPALPRRYRGNHMQYLQARCAPCLHDGGSGRDRRPERGGKPPNGGIDFRWSDVPDTAHVVNNSMLVAHGVPPFWRVGVSEHPDARHAQAAPKVHRPASVPEKKHQLPDRRPPFSSPSPPPPFHPTPRPSSAGAPPPMH